MKRTQITLAVVLAFLAAACGRESSPSPEPTWDSNYNILWLVAEDLGPYIPPFGDSTVVTPALSRLAEEGVVYTHVFSPSGVCAPSRAAIATGMYPTRIGAMHMRTGPWYSGNPPEETIAAYVEQLPQGIVPYEAVPPPSARMHSEYLRRVGYYATNRSKNDYQFRAPLTAWDENGPDAHWRSRRSGQPFFSIFNFEVTHESRIWTKAEDTLLVAPDLGVPVPPYLPDTEVALRDIRRMYSNIVEMDRDVGEVLAELEADGLLDSTIVFWYADHGGPLPRQKRSAYDSGLRSPMIIRYPGKWRAGETDDRLISFVDFLPTILSMAGAEPPEGADGLAFEGRYVAKSPRRYIHAAVDRLDENPNAVRAVGDRRFKYLRHLRPELGMFVPVAYRMQMPLMRELIRLRDEDLLTDAQALWFRSTRPHEELFDVDADPHEIRNVAGDPDFRDKLVELRREVDRWMESTGDRGVIPEQRYLASIWPAGEQPVTLPPRASLESGRISLSTDTPGGLIGYQEVDAGADPGSSWSIYQRPLALSEGTEIVAIAHRIGYLQSDTIRVRPDGSTRRADE